MNTMWFPVQNTYVRAYIFVCTYTREHLLNYHKFERYDVNSS